MPDSPTPAKAVEAEQARAAAAVAASGAQAHAALAGTPPHTGGAFVGVPAQLAERVRAIVGASNCITEKQELRTYECDGLTSFRVTPGMVVLPISTDEVVRVVKLVHAAGLPISPRGSGTGLSARTRPS